MSHAGAIFGKTQLIIRQVNLHDIIDLGAKPSKRSVCKMIHIDNWLKMRQHISNKFASELIGAIYTF